MEGGVVAFIVLVVLIAAVAVPVTLAQNTTSWDANTKTIYALIPLALVLVVLITAFRMTGSA